MEFWRKNKSSSRRQIIDPASSMRQHIIDGFWEGYENPDYIALQDAMQPQTAYFVYKSLLSCRKSAIEGSGVDMSIGTIGSRVAAIKNVEAREYFKERFLEYCRNIPDGRLEINDVDKQMYEKAARG